MLIGYTVFCIAYSAACSVAHDIDPVKRDFDNNGIFPEFISTPPITPGNDRHSPSGFLTDMQLQKNLGQLAVDRN